MPASAAEDALFYKPRGIPVFVMLPLDTVSSHAKCLVSWFRNVICYGLIAFLQVNADGVFRYATTPWFTQALHLLAASGVYGVAVDAWVGQAFY